MAVVLLVLEVEAGREQYRHCLLLLLLALLLLLLLESVSCLENGALQCIATAMMVLLLLPLPLLPLLLLLLLLQLQESVYHSGWAAAAARY